ncbi:MAG: YbfB/YjiJ family MFS transporter [Chloroflexaceae bacterium]|nr:YbfB/YjiJ family MFS transporter [Chloroflexaceae bacterium]
MVRLSMLLRMPVVLIAAAQFALALGGARLAFGLLLPGMAETLATSAALLGTVGTLNLVGYLVGTLLVPWLQRRATGRWLMLVCGLVLGVSLLLTAVASNLVALGALRFVSGVVSAPLMILAQSFALEGVPATARGRVMGIVWGGGAVGILLSGLVAPWAFVGEGWRMVWGGMGGIGLLITLGWFLLVKQELPRREATAAAGSAAPLWTPGLRWLALAYSLFGAGYISYFTYAVAAFVQYGLPPQDIGYVWATLGVMGLLSGPFWGMVIDHRPTARVLAGVLAIGALGTTTVIMPHPWLLIGGAALVGWCAFIAPPLIVATLVRHRVDAANFPAVFSVCTLGLGLGQVGAPLLGAALSGSIGVGGAALLSAVAFGVGALAAWQAMERPASTPVVSANQR